MEAASEAGRWVSESTIPERIHYGERVSHLFGGSQRPFDAVGDTLRSTAGVDDGYVQAPEELLEALF